MAYKFEQAGKTKWRVQVNRQGIKVNKVFADETEAKIYEKKIIEDGGRSVWAVQPSLVRLLRSSLQGDVVCRDDALPETDFYIPLLSLPLAFKAYEPFDAGTYLLCMLL